jgi:hypothetical protein
MAKTWLLAGMALFTILFSTACTREFRNLLGIQKLPEGTPELEKFKPKYSGLIVYMPKPRDEIASLTDIFYTSYIYRHKEGSYTLAWGLVPGVYGPPSAYQKALDESCERVIKALGGTITFQSVITYSRATAAGDMYGFKGGKELEGTLGDSGNWFRARVYMIGKTCYQLIAIGSKEWINSPTSLNFLQSLELTN